MPAPQNLAEADILEAEAAPSNARPAAAAVAPFPAMPALPLIDLGEAEPVLQVIPIPSAVTTVRTQAGAIARHIPWTAVISLGLVLLAQLMLEPRENRTWTNGVAFYALAAVALVWAYARSEWIPTPLPEEKLSVFPMTFRRDALLAAVPLALISFLMFGGNRFTLANVTLWLVSIALFVRAFWVSQPQVRTWYARLWSFISQPRWGLVFSRWTSCWRSYWQV